jgi:hypothetical protein
MFAVELGWLNVLRRYFVAIALGNLVWEFAYMPHSGGRHHPRVPYA